MKRKHRVMVEVTFGSSVTEKTAVQVVNEIIGNADTDQIIGAHIGLDSKNAYPTHFKCKEGSRVIAAEKQKG